MPTRKERELMLEATIRDLVKKVDEILSILKPEEGDPEDD